MRHRYSNIKSDVTDLRSTEMEAKSKQDKKTVIVHHSEEERQKILFDAVPENTRNATKRALKHLNQYISTKNGGLTLTIDDIGTEELPQLLYEFYTDAQYKSSESETTPEKYKNTTLNSIRAGINRHLKDQRGIDIIKDERFVRSNQMFKAVKKANKKEGKGNVDHKITISHEDMKKLDNYFRQYMRPSARILQQFCLFNILFYGCRRGRENLSAMEKDTFEVTSLHFN